MTDGPVGVGVIGAGVISTQYLENLTTFPDLRVLFVADIDPDRARAQAAKFGLPGSGSVEELLAHTDIEIVVNLTIPAAHAEVSMRAVQAGKHVWSEKPFSTDRAGGRALLEAAHDRGLRVACAPDTILGAGLQTAQRLIQDGRIGEPLTAITMMQASGPEAWHPNPDFLYAVGGGPLFDMGPYYVTTLVLNLGPVKRVAALGSTALARRTIATGPRAGETFPVEVPTHVSALIEFEDGASAQCVFSFQSSIQRQGFVEISGTEGAIVLPDPNRFEGESRIHTDGRARPQVVRSRGVTTTRGTGVLELARAIRAGVPERASGELGYHVVDVMLAIVEAVDTGEFVTVESTVTPPAPLPLDFDPRARTL
jgi:predicted dehydrogenase